MLNLKNSLATQLALKSHSHHLLMVNGNAQINMLRPQEKQSRISIATSPVKMVTNQNSQPKLHVTSAQEHILTIAKHDA